MRKFVTANWTDLIMVNYEVHPGILKPYVPFGTELDIDDGKCFVSLVAFKFLNTRVLGIPIPFHRNFDEINLRFYVTREHGDELRRGVVFIKELVPRAAVTFVARTLYGERYETWDVSHTHEGQRLKYSWAKNGSRGFVAVSSQENLGVPDRGSHEEFIIEHYWGYTARANGKTDEYRVEHPKWEIRSVDDVEMDVDFGRIYGDEFGPLATSEPFSILLAEGSAISVYKGKAIDIAD